MSTISMTRSSVVDQLRGRIISATRHRLELYVRRAAVLSDREIFHHLTFLADCRLSSYELSVGFAVHGRFNSRFWPLGLVRNDTNGKTGEIVIVDGHDFGSGKFNILVLTNEPSATFTQAHQVILDEGIPNGLRSAYRRRTGEENVILWPPALTEFSVL